MHPAFAVGAGDTSLKQVDKIPAYVLSGRGGNILKCVTMVHTLRGEGLWEKGEMEESIGDLTEK